MGIGEYHTNTGTRDALRCRAAVRRGCSSAQAQTCLEKGSAGGRHGLVLGSFLPNPSPLSPAAPGQRGLNRLGDLYWGEAVSQAQPKLCLHPHKSLQPRGNRGSFTQVLQALWAGLRAPKALHSKGCGPVLPITLWDSVCRDFFLLPTTKPPAGNLLLTFLFLFVGSNPFLVPGQFSSLPPVPHLCPGPVSVTPGWSQPALRSILSSLCSQGEGSPSQQDLGNGAGADQPSVILAGSGLAPARLCHTKQRVQLHRKAGIHFIEPRKSNESLLPCLIPCMNQQSCSIQRLQAGAFFPVESRPRQAAGKIQEFHKFCSRGNLLQHNFPFLRQLCTQSLSCKEKRKKNLQFWGKPGQSQLFPAAFSDTTALGRVLHQSLRMLQAHGQNEESVKVLFRLIFLCVEGRRNPDGIWPTQQEANPRENILQDLWVCLVCLGYRSFSQIWFPD